MYATGKIVGAAIGIGADGAAIAAAIAGEFTGGVALVRWLRERLTLDRFSTRRHDFGRADRRLAEKLGLSGKRAARAYRKRERLSWHHNQDGRTLELVPRDLHPNLPHQGGISTSGRGAP